MKPNRKEIFVLLNDEFYAAKMEAIEKDRLAIQKVYKTSAYKKLEAQQKKLSDAAMKIGMKKEALVKPYEGQNNAALCRRYDEIRLKIACGAEYEEILKLFKQLRG